MRRFTALAAALAASFAVTSAHALVIIVDEFNEPELVLFDTVGGDAVAAFADQTPDRVVYHELLTSVNNPTGLQSSVLIGDAAFPVGTLQMSNGNSVTSSVRLDWTLAAGIVPTDFQTFFFFNVVESDDVAKNVSFSLDGGTSFIANYAIGAATNQDLVFALTQAQQDTLNVGGTLSMFVTGNNGWDLTLDSFGFNIPEPTSMALVGLALVGAGLASRRRQQA